MFFTIYLFSKELAVFFSSPCCDLLKLEKRDITTTSNKLNTKFLSTYLCRYNYIISKTFET
ncbi:hypothetical protein C7S20_07955 [Christiangramia fulva]|uniref:Uncharacterized protein n=1 Tax=Christiangramia fulva TaxID=2126553 RepID=A0A2R3Z4Q3_9FLAO|nr:hypothetical protein C7S20_07955 [Christiangramia fulva]